MGWEPRKSIQLETPQSQGQVTQTGIQVVKSKLLAGQATTSCEAVLENMLFFETM